MNDQILLYLIYNLRKETIQPVVCGSKFGKKEVAPSPRGIINLSSERDLVARQVAFNDDKAGPLPWPSRDEVSTRGGRVCKSPWCASYFSRGAPCVCKSTSRPPRASRPAAFSGVGD